MLDHARRRAAAPRPSRRRPDSHRASVPIGQPARRRVARSPSSRNGGTSVAQRASTSRAARVERAPARQPDEARRQARDRGQPLAGGALGRQRGEQAACVRMVRAVEERAPVGASPWPARRTSRARRRRSRRRRPRSCVIRMIAVPNSGLQAPHEVDDLGLHGHVERGRRLVRDQQPADSARPPSRSSPAAACRPRTGAGSRRRAARAAGSRPGRAARSPAGAPVARETCSCSADHLRDLPADPVERMQARERILEDHRDPRAAHRRAAPRAGHGEQVTPLEQRAARDRRAVSQADDRLGRDALARSGLADDAERPAALDGERDAPHRLDDSVAGVGTRPRGRGPRAAAPSPACSRPAVHSRRRPPAADRGTARLGHVSQTLVGSQLSVKKKKLQPCRWSPSSRRATSASSAARSLRPSSSGRVGLAPELRGRLAGTGAVSALSISPVVMGLSYPE